MGTYTTNYNLFLPSIGEQGWGDLVNGNFTTIDATMKGLDTRLTTCESTDVVYNTRLETLEAGEFETIDVAGSITADEFVGGVGNFSSLTQVKVPYTVSSIPDSNALSITLQGSSISTTLQPSNTYRNVYTTPSYSGLFTLGTIEDTSQTVTVNITVSGYEGDYDGAIYVTVNGINAGSFTIRAGHPSGSGNISMPLSTNNVFGIRSEYYIFNANVTFGNATVYIKPNI